MRRLALACAVASVVSAGCGDSGDPARGESDRAKVEAAVGQYMQALADGDGQAACDRLTEPAQRNLATATGASSCETGIAKLAGSFDDRGREALGEVRVTEAEIMGAKASVKLASGQTRPPAPVPLEKADGTWRLAGFPSRTTFKSQAEAECISGAMSAFPEDSDPFWRKEGRADFRDYTVAVCRRADRSGVLATQDRAAFERIMRKVLLQMIKSGKIRDPRR